MGPGCANEIGTQSLSNDAHKIGGRQQQQEQAFTEEEQDGRTDGRRDKKAKITPGGGGGKEKKKEKRTKEREKGGTAGRTEGSTVFCPRGSFQRRRWRKCIFCFTDNFPGRKRTPTATQQMNSSELIRRKKGCQVPCKTRQRQDSRVAFLGKMGGKQNNTTRLRPPSLPKKYRNTREKGCHIGSTCQLHIPAMSVNPRSRPVFTCAVAIMTELGREAGHLLLHSAAVHQTARQSSDRGREGGASEMKSFEVQRQNEFGPSERAGGRRFSHT